MKTINLHRDGFVLLLLVIMLLMLVSALSGAYRLFGYALVALLGSLMGLGFVRRGNRVTWLPPLIATTVLLGAFAGVFANETAIVRDVGDTVLGFQAGTAFLIYGVWIPPFFTMGVSFALVFDRLSGGDGSTSSRKRENR